MLNAIITWIYADWDNYILLKKNVIKYVFLCQFSYKKLKINHMVIFKQEAIWICFFGKFSKYR